MFLWQWSIHEMVLFGGFLGPNSPKYCHILPKFLLEVVFNESQTVFEEFWKRIFLQKCEIPKVCTFGTTLTPLFPLKMAKVEKDKYFLNKNLAIGLSKNRKIKVVSPLPIE